MNRIRTMHHLQGLDISSEMERLGVEYIVFYGSETGTAESYASRLAIDGKRRFGLEIAVADPAKYDFKSLHSISDNRVVIFLLATASDGEPTSNAVGLYNSITCNTSLLNMVGDDPLRALTFIAFGLGDSTRDQFNAMVRNTNSALLHLGARRIGELGLGDDGEGTLEEDFLAWKDSMWVALQRAKDLRLENETHKANLTITEQPHLTKESTQVFVGEHDEKHLQGSMEGTSHTPHPFVAPVHLRELFRVDDRNCLHLDIDITGTDISYATGDHVAIWPMNPDEEVDRLIKILNLSGKEDTVIKLQSAESIVYLPPSPTTYESIFRNYMDICGLVSRHLVATLASYAPDLQSKAEMIRLGSDKSYFQEQVTQLHLNIGCLLEIVGKGRTWDRLPLAILIESLHRLTPRYYSISSSSLEHPTTISVTAIVESRPIEGRADYFYGVGTNYLLALKHASGYPRNGVRATRTYRLNGPRDRLIGIKIPIHIRHSNFKLPVDPLIPIIMVGPGTGIAPFRGFVRERMCQTMNKTVVGPTLLFFGCRHREQDYIYEEEFANIEQVMGGKFKIVTAFSRESSKKVYVQNRMLEMGKEINRLLQRHAYFYVCGDATSMAHEVKAVLTRIISEQRGIHLAEAESVLSHMKTTRSYQEDVWS